MGIKIMKSVPSKAFEDLILVPVDKHKVNVHVQLIQYICCGLI